MGVQVTTTENAIRNSERLDTLLEVALFVRQTTEQMGTSHGTRAILNRVYEMIQEAQK